MKSKLLIGIFVIAVLAISMAIIYSIFQQDKASLGDVKNNDSSYNIISPVPSYHPYGINGHVNLDGHAISGAHVEAVSLNGTDRLNTTTDDNGAYTLNIKSGTDYNLSATWQGLRHTIWPVSIGDKYYEYNISLSTTSRSFIEGTGYSIGGPIGYNNSQPLTGFEFYATPVNGNSKLTTVIQNDWSYSLEVEPGVMYHMERHMPDVWFNYRNNNRVLSLDVVVGPNETAFIDYEVILP